MFAWATRASTATRGHSTAQCAAQNGYFSRNGSAGADVCVLLGILGFLFGTLLCAYKDPHMKHRARSECPF